MALCGGTLLDTIRIVIEKEAGGVLGCDLEAVVVDPTSDWSRCIEKARERPTVQQFGAILGNWTSVSRRSVLRAIDELNGLLVYPMHHECEESSKNMY